MITCTCNRCGWVHMAVTLKFAEEEVTKFNSYYATLSAQEKEQYYKGSCSSIKSYGRCFFCGQTEGDFRESVDGDCPRGCTIQPTIWEG